MDTPTLSLIVLAALIPSSVVFGEALNIGNRKQLFIDETFVEHGKGVTLQMNPPIKQGLVMSGTNPWGNGIVSGAGSVIEDGGKYRFWYTAMPASLVLIEHTRFRLCYGESTDGVHWVKPNLGLYEWEGSKANNIVMDSEIESGGGVFLDPAAHRPGRLRRGMSLLT